MKADNTLGFSPSTINTRRALKSQPSHATTSPSSSAAFKTRVWVRTSFCRRHESQVEEEAHEEVEEEAPKDETEIQVVCSFAVTDHQSTSFRFRLRVLFSNQILDVLINVDVAHKQEFCLRNQNAALFRFESVTSDVSSNLGHWPNGCNIRFPMNEENVGAHIFCRSGYDPCVENIEANEDENKGEDGDSNGDEGRVPGDVGVRENEVFSFTNDEDDNLEPNM
ncbi:hypothetical protein ACFXTH_001439 [Malus domestica]